MPDKLEERLREVCIDWTGEPIVDDSTPRYEVHCGLLREAADEITRLKGEVERLSAEVAAWGNIASGLRAYLEDRRNEGDHITPEKVLSILEGDIRIMEERSRQIYAATQYRSQAAETALAAKQAFIDELVEGLSEARPLLVGQMQAAGGCSLPESHYEGHPSVRSIDALIARARSSGKAGSDA